MKMNLEVEWVLISFYGTIDLKDLIVARSDVDLETLIYKTFTFVYTDLE